MKAKLVCALSPFFLCDILFFIHNKKAPFGLFRMKPNAANWDADQMEVFVRPENANYQAFGRPKNDLVLRVIENKDTERAQERIPVWFMRQAGRYLPEYREMRAKYDFIQMCQNPHLSSEVTIMPFKRFSCDMLVIFSDILIIFIAMGMHVQFVENVGPKFDKTVSSFEEFQKLIPPLEQIIKNLHYVYDSISLTKHKINNAVPLLGFAGSPFTLFTYLTKNNKKTYEDTIQMIYERPGDVHNILNKLSEVCVSHLINQIDSGANVIQLFESNADIIDTNLFCDFSLFYLKKVINMVKKLRPHAFIILFLKENFHPDVKDLNIDVLSITHKQLAANTSTFYYNLFDGKIILQGALDPHIMLVNDENLVSKYTCQMVSQIRHTNKYIANLGHGMLPGSKIENVQAFIDTVGGYFPA
ncbi:uroporphyrinogen III decarboxylase, putative [Plasmodium knowlesi strain H]|uniref:Uroporphyrinogen decarboxylase n=3 Tax=Plasmodium knowlesi TaxID=5850 RepID=A0A5K1U879_PLAKH|nr:uroporphyrinogen III decarboxylase, putative [Plasmodium knowlesi strain H]OTN64381.1 Uroporphyrinogen decarboxylase [Plasmodium knowlesi]CAA9989256.1 uroporphyrinogen III decarboxylase, putative [Plasmodium knowlesi strain H]SBO26175.1 uroporphyrinogen III decarboxylase, putative [Plasmodium knowlesi strain H]SBO26970.1 uroporphyrinogen III decarboxylase, putative [Plasmodium knowlesi strain H]VVS78730.1 uroporphyrinogen III decarboxylase, putative [Plasmodium knowlesi strain H]|eukprot:XP_002261602.1 uroporphyrinogen decarboxylase, putative [Plasmodium knowlesi strain H]